MSATEEQATGSLRVSIASGSDIPPGLVTDIDRAVHRAVLGELAEMDIGSDYRVTDLANSGTGEGHEVEPAPAQTNIGLVIVINVGSK